MLSSNSSSTNSRREEIESKVIQSNSSEPSASGIETSSPTNLNYDEGARAWFVGAWLVQFCVLGLPLSFGVMESFYAQEYLATFTPSTINWIGSIQLCFQFLLGVVVAGVFDAGHFRWISISGSFLFVFSMFMLSLAKEDKYYQVFFAQGLGMGIAIGLLYTPTSSAVSQHFKKRRGFAMGIITTGGALGGAFFSIVLGHFLNGPIGFAWGVRICAFICLVCLTLANFLMSPNYPPPTPKSEVNAPPIGIPLNQLVRSTSSIAFILFAFVISISLYNPMFSVELFALRNAHVSQTLGGYLLAILNMSSIFGRLFFNRLADRYGVFEIYIPCIAATDMAYSLVLVRESHNVLLSLDRDVARSGLCLGLASVPVGIASLVGTPIAAAVVGGVRFHWCSTSGLVRTSSMQLVSSFETD
ncbi:hypothetical protein CVT25_015437 [Psilocybe cyanescens]|uniref:Major facilitator superfamily (MFS) profile domain-containing protein n=1 Tax=Psilocybe cyanescens TaxID=93625 RepID=A0A409WHH4_PSICY|nr:hypothetical protein CVT25_015437 [Psilocybe cyanescens]